MGEESKDGDGSYKLTEEEIKTAMKKFEKMDDEKKAIIHKECQETMAKLILERDKGTKEKPE